MSERRSKQRFEVCLDVIVEGATGRARVADLSESGCYVDTMFEAFPGQRLQVEMRLPNGERLEFQGEVAYNVPSLGFGMRFVDMDAITRQRLLWFIGNIDKLRDDFLRRRFA